MISLLSLLLPLPLPADAPVPEARAGAVPEPAQRGHTLPVLDQVEIRPAASLAVLWQLAVTGLRTLSAALPPLQAAVKALPERPTPAPSREAGAAPGPASERLVRLAAEVGAAAHLVATGARAVLAAGAAAAPSPDTPDAAMVPPEPSERLPEPHTLASWRTLAAGVVHEAELALGQAQARLDTPAATAAGGLPGGAALGFVSMQVAGAQRQLAGAAAALAEAPCPAIVTFRSDPASDEPGLPPVAAALAATGLFLLLALLFLFAATSLAVAAAACVAGSLGAAALAGWRVTVGARGLRLELAR